MPIKSYTKRAGLSVRFCGNKKHGKVQVDQRLRQCGIGVSEDCNTFCKEIFTRGSVNVGLANVTGPWGRWAQGPTWAQGPCHE